MQSAASGANDAFIGVVIAWIVRDEALDVPGGVRAAVDKDGILK